MTTDEVIRLKDSEQKVSDFAQQLKAEHQQRLTTGQCGVFQPIPERKENIDNAHGSWGQQQWMFGWCWPISLQGRVRRTVVVAIYTYAPRTATDIRRYYALA